MFTGIIEDLGEVISLEKQKGNLNITCKSCLSPEFKIDQSVSHNGACLTVVDIKGEFYTVTAIDETLSKTNLKELKLGDKINLERSIKLEDRIDGHIVQGHIDQIGVCSKILEKDGSWIFTFNHEELENVTVKKGSICINGVSLTVIDSRANSFSVAVIPFTFENTNFNAIKINTKVNIEFDILGKYIQKILKKSNV